MLWKIPKILAPKKGRLEFLSESVRSSLGFYFFNGRQDFQHVRDIVYDC